MADKDSKVPENVTGPIYVDQTCISAKYCTSVAPNNFKISENQGQAFVCKQPENDEEKEMVHDAIMGCPVSAIGDDGED
jgi:ferredoxin